MSVKQKFRKIYNVPTLERVSEFRARYPGYVDTTVPFENLKTSQ